MHRRPVRLLRRGWARLRATGWVDSPASESDVARDEPVANRRAMEGLRNATAVWEMRGPQPGPRRTSCSWAEPPVMTSATPRRPAPRPGPRATINLQR